MAYAVNELILSITLFRAPVPPTMPHHRITSARRAYLRERGAGEHDLDEHEPWQ